MTGPGATPAAGASDGTASIGVPSIGWFRAARAAASIGFGRAHLWPLALLAYLLRGGLILHLAPIVVIPSTVGLATFIGPTAVTPAGPSEELTRLVVFIVVVAAAWLVIGGLGAATAEIALIRRSPRVDPCAATAANPPVERRVTLDLGLALRCLLVRFAASAPLVVALALAIPQIVGAAYHELTSPVETATPLPVRVLADVPGVLFLALALWLLGETVGGLAVRRIVLFGERGPRATLMAVVHVVRHPIATAATAALLAGGSLILVAPGLVASGMAWGLAGRGLVEDTAIGQVGSVLAFVGVWTAGLVFAATAAAWRSVAWTLEVTRAAGVAGPVAR